MNVLTAPLFDNPVRLLGAEETGEGVVLYFGNAFSVVRMFAPLQLTDLSSLANKDFNLEITIQEIEAAEPDNIVSFEAYQRMKEVKENEQQGIDMSMPPAQ